MKPALLVVENEDDGVEGMLEGGYAGRSERCVPVVVVMEPRGGCTVADSAEAADAADAAENAEKAVEAEF